MESIYTSRNTTAAYQLNWSIALFGKSELPLSAINLRELGIATAKDGIRLLSASVRSDNVLQFLASTRPETSPSACVCSLKGRLQYLIRAQAPRAFRRNYHIQSVGEQSSAKLEGYVAAQTNKHPMVDPMVQARLEAVQFHDNLVDLALPTIGTYGQYLNSLHIVLENENNWHEVRSAELHGVREVIISAASDRGWRLSRIGLLSNHMHVLLGARVTTPPEDVALALMNNIIRVYAMKPILKFSYYIGTFGPYDRGAVRLRAQTVAGSAGASPTEADNQTRIKAGE